MEGIFSSVAPSTLKTYFGAIRQFELFMGWPEGHHKWPVSNNNLLQYLCNLRRRGVSAKVMSIHLAAVSFFCKASGFSDPCATFRIRRAVAGWKRAGGHTSDPRRPITTEILEELVRATKLICRDKYEANLFRAAFALAFWGALRLGEVVAGAKNDRSGRALASSDIALQKQRVSIRIRVSKTDQCGRGTWIPILRQDNKRVCPRRAVAKFLKIRPNKGQYFFCHRDSTPLTRYQFMAVCRQALRHLGLPAQDFGGHSFRIGRATVAAGNGDSLEAIKVLGRWKSEAVKRYIRPDRCVQIPAQQR